MMDSYNQICYMTYPRGKGMRKQQHGACGVFDGVPSTARSSSELHFIKKTHTHTHELVLLTKYEYNQPMGI